MDPVMLGTQNHWFRVPTVLEFRPAFGRPPERDMYVGAYNKTCICNELSTSVPPTLEQSV